VQVNGKMRSKLFVPADTPASELEKLAFEDVHIKRHTDGKKIIKKIVVPNRLVNIVVAG
jgi:leucyl-tRNA synthetase